MFCCICSSRIFPTSSGFSPSMDFAEGPFRSGYVSYWSPRISEKIHCYAVSGKENKQNIKMFGKMVTFTNSRDVSLESCSFMSNILEMFVD